MKGPGGPELREIREKKKKEEKNEVEGLPNCDHNQLLHRSSFVIRLVFVLRI